MPTIIYQRKPLFDSSMVANNEWDWKLFPQTEAFLSGQIRSYLRRNRYADVVRGEIENTTSTRFIDWVDSMELPDDIVSEQDLLQVGYVKWSVIGGASDVYVHLGGKFFPISLRPDKEHHLSIKVDDLDRFLAANHLSQRIAGRKNAPLRSTELNHEGGNSFQAVERRGSRPFDLNEPNDTEEYAAALNLLSTRIRTFDDDVHGIEDLKDMIAALAVDLSPPRLADAFFLAERNYWQTKNRAGQVQFKRQELLGLGWANHDHHTFRCSRENFGKVISILEGMGFKRRERFFAGAQAGWGAQVMEQPVSGLVVFADVDLGPEESHVDFVGSALEPLEKLGTVGLWVGLHGESVLDAGMHHLAVESDFMGLRRDLETRNVTSMAPFSNFDFLRQSFTEAERWLPPKERVERLRESGLVSDDQASRFKEHGAIGSHLEIIQRDRGFMGFNQDSVSVIIRMTDPNRRSGKGA